MPMWDNTPRRNNHGNVIFHGATLALYKKWLSDIIFHYKKVCCLDDDLIFINEWNEWGEGAYLEPDRYYGYAYLEATKAAMEEMHNKIGGKLMINQKKIGIVILNYNDAISTLHLVHLIHDYSVIDHVVLVDNLSPDGSMNDLQKAVDNKIDVIQSDRNGGYSYGNNFGAFYLIEKYNIDILFIANPDVEFTEDFLIRVVSDMERYNAKAASGYMEMPKTAPKVVRNPKINSVLRETIDCTILIKHIFPFKGAVLHKGCGVKRVEWIPGSLFAIDAKTYKKLNGLDDRVFLFYEEQILGWKFIQARYKMVIDTDISYFHNHSVSINKSIKRYGQVKQLFHSKYYFYKTYVGMNLALQLLMKLAIVYGLFMRKLLYRVI